MESLHNVFKRVFDLDLPISGGDGQSVEDPIIIDADEGPVALEYQIIELIHQLGGKKYTFEGQSLISRGDRKIDKLSIVLDEDQEHIRSYYFDITKSFSRF
ncbi:hypothetical protein KBC54_02090 [Patescibacteria group bacterium]|nr:hypothetical protein [Patescibacteria group bacterium]